MTAELGALIKDIQANAELAIDRWVAPTEDGAGVALAAGSDTTAIGSDGPRQEPDTPDGRGSTTVSERQD